MYPVKQSTALPLLIFAYDSNGDPVTGKIDANWTKRISKNGGSFAAMTVTITEAENGWYSLTFSTAHTDTLGVLSLTFIATGVKQINLQYKVTVRDYDDVTLATGAITTTTFAAGAIDAAAIATDAIGANELAAGAATKVRDTILSDATPFAGGNINATISSRATPAQVNVEVLDVMTTDTFAEPTAVPAATASLKDKIVWLCTLARNKITQTSTTQTLRNDADSATIATSAVSDDGTTFIRAEWS